MARKKENSIVKGLSLMGFGRDGNSSVIDTRDGKIIRIRPLHDDWHYDWASLTPWKMAVRG